MRSVKVEPPTPRSTPSILKETHSISGFRAFPRQSCGTQRFRSARAAWGTIPKANSFTSIRVPSASGLMRRAAPPHTVAIIVATLSAAASSLESVRGIRG